MSSDVRHKANIIELNGATKHECKGVRVEKGEEMVLKS